MSEEASTVPTEGGGVKRRNAGEEEVESAAKRKALPRTPKEARNMLQKLRQDISDLDYKVKVARKLEEDMMDWQDNLDHMEDRERDERHLIFTKTTELEKKTTQLESRRAFFKKVQETHFTAVQDQDKKQKMDDTLKAVKTDLETARKEYDELRGKTMVKISDEIVLKVKVSMTKRELRERQGNCEDSSRESTPDFAWSDVREKAFGREEQQQNLDSESDSKSEAVKDLDKQLSNIEIRMDELAILLSAIAPEYAEIAEKNRELEELKDEKDAFEKILANGATTEKLKKRFAEVKHELEHIAEKNREPEELKADSEAFEKALQKGATTEKLEKILAEVEHELEQLERQKQVEPGTSL